MVIKRGSDREHGHNFVPSAPHLVLCLLVAELPKRLFYIRLLNGLRNRDRGVKDTIKGRLVLETFLPFSQLLLVKTLQILI